MVARIQGDQIFANFRLLGDRFLWVAFVENGKSRPNFGLLLPAVITLKTNYLG
jgi:hypothetical protein